MKTFNDGSDEVKTEDGYIVHKCLNGDSAAFGFLVDKYRAGVFAFAYERLHNFHDAEDVAQEVFLKAYKSLRTLRRWDSFASWLYRITSNLCKNWVRAQFRRPDREFIEDQDQQVLETPSGDLHRRELIRESVQEALSSLTEMYRQVLTLHYLGGMTSVENARFVGASPAAIRMRLGKARSLLKEEILAVMNTTFEEQKLQATFTFRIAEAVKRMKIQPMPRTTGLPWGLSLAAGIVLTILSLNPHMSIFDPMDIPGGAPLPVQAKVLETGEIPVDILAASQISALASKQGDSEGGDPKLPEPEKALLGSSSSVQDDSTSSSFGAILGKVTDAAHPRPHNLEGAIVTVKNNALLAAEGGKRTVTTDSNGEYRVDNLPPGEYIMAAIKPGYEPSEDRVTVTPRGEAFHDIRMYLKGTEVGPPEYAEEIRKRRAKPKLRSPQEPQEPYPYREEEVVYQNRETDIEIAGTFTFPDSDGPFPAVILLSDYGPDDRDELMPIHVEEGIREFRPFLVLADYLTRQGIAVLRTDDRGVGGSTGSLFESTIGNLTNDALAGIEYLKSQKKVNTAQIALIGCGMGSIVALETADQSEDIAFIVLMAGIGLKGEDLTLLRIRLIGESIGWSDEEIEKRTEINKRIFPVLKQEKDDEIAMQKIRDIIADVTVKFSETKLSEEEIQAIRRSSDRGHFNKLKPYFRSFLAFDPGPALTKLKRPVLAFNSEKNPSIPPKQNLDAIEVALKAGGNENYTIKELPGLNQLFQTVHPGVPQSEIEETISPVVLKLIGDWILEQTKGKQE